MFVIQLSFLACIGLTTWGLMQMFWSGEIVFGWSSLINYAVYIMIGMLVVAIIGKWIKLNAIVTGALIGCIIAITTGAIWPLLVTIWFGFACYVVGLYFLKLCKVDVIKVTGLTLFLVGACLYGTAVGLSAHFRVNYPGIYALALIIPIIIGWRLIHAAIHSFRDYLTIYSEIKILDIVIALIALVHFSVSLMPEVGHDALAGHLFIPGHLHARQMWSFDVNTYVWAVMPMLGSWLYSIGYMLAGEQASRLINVGFIFVLCWLIRDLVIWAGGRTIGARWAVLLFLTTPLTFTESSSLFIESVWTAFVVAGSMAVFKLVKSEDDQGFHLVTAGIFLGGALASKAVTFTILPALLLILIVRYKTWSKPKLMSSIVLGLVLFLGIGSFHYVRAWYFTGNPVFPFFNHIFESSYWPPIAFEPPAIFNKGINWDVVYQLTFHSQRFLEGRAGAAGFHLLLLLLPAFLIILAVRNVQGFILLFVAVLSVTLTFHSTAYLRYVFPSFVWLAAVIGLAISINYGKLYLSRYLLNITLIIAILLNFFFLRSGTFYGDISLQAMISNGGREAYLNKRLPIRNAVQLVNRLNIGNAPVAVFGSPLTAGLNSDALYPNWYNYRFRDNVSKITTSRDMAQMLLLEGVHYLILDRDWGDSEKRNMIENITLNISNFDNISVLRLNDDIRFQIELLKNSDFNYFDGWVFSNENIPQLFGQVLVSVSSPVTQSVSVIPGRWYQNSVTAMCTDIPSQGRIQVNWMDVNGKFITTDIQVFDCTLEESSHSMDIIAPARASTANVYATGHSDIPILIKKVTFRQ